MIIFLYEQENQVLDGIEPLAKLEGSRAEELVRRIEALIGERGPNGDPRLGSKDDLRQIFKVAHGTMNEAMRVLETRGVIELKRGPQGGVFMASPSVKARWGQVFLGLRRSSKSVAECLAVRNQIEPLIMAEAAGVAAEKPEEVAALYALVDKMEESIDEPTKSIRWNWALHKRIASMGTNTILTGIYMALIEHIEQEVDEVAPSRSPKRVVAMHRGLVDAIASGNPQEAAAAAEHHPLPPDSSDETEGASGSTLERSNGAG
jgi:DNA-binding FadR family transcriptional regulator